MKTTTSVSENDGNPLLRIGTYGTHVLKCPTGKYIFRGTVPGQLSKTVCDSFNDAMDAFRDWFRSMPMDEQREHAANLRNDVFAFVMSALEIKRRNLSASQR